MATLHCISGGKRVNTREMLDKAASVNYRMAAENACLKQQVDTLRSALIECRSALSAQSRKNLSPKIARMLASVRPSAKKLRAQAAGQS